MEPFVDELGIAVAEQRLEIDGGMGRLRAGLIGMRRGHGVLSGMWDGNTAPWETVLPGGNRQRDKPVPRQVTTATPGGAGMASSTEAGEP